MAEHPNPQPKGRTTPDQALCRPVRQRVSQTVERLFSHAADPLAHTADHPGDPGLFGPGSVSWEVIGHTSAFVGGIRALLLQAAHPEVLAGVADHSRYRQDPLGRLSRTANYVTATTFGAMPEVGDAIDAVRKAHQRVTGISSRGIPYTAADPHLAAWVHNTLTDSFLAAYQTFGPGLDCAQADRFVAEQTRVGALLGADPLPDTAAGLHDWIVHHPDLDVSPPLAATMRFLSRPPLPLNAQFGYQFLHRGAVATIPANLTALLGLKPALGAVEVARMALKGLSWALGPSPSRQAAHNRSIAGADPAAGDEVGPEPR